MVWSEHPKALLKSINHHPSKRWGQNFIWLPEHIQSIVNACPLDPNLEVLEIGPGLGALTLELSKRVKRVLALEADGILGQYLKEKFQKNDVIEVVVGDALEIKFSQLMIKPSSFQVISNLPYNVGTEIIFRLLDQWERIPLMAFMVQKEVSQRLQAKPSQKSYGRLSVLPQVFYEIKSVYSLRGEQFYPRVEVDSEFVVFLRRKTPLIDLSDPKFSKFFKELLKIYFSWRRKTLINSLIRGNLLSSESWNQILKTLQIDGKRRGETLSLKEMEKIARLAFVKLN